MTPGNYRIQPHRRFYCGVALSVVIVFVVLVRRGAHNPSIGKRLLFAYQYFNSLPFISISACDRVGVGAG